MAKWKHTHLFFLLPILFLFTFIYHLESWNSSSTWSFLKGTFFGYRKTSSSSITIVTAYWNLGTFQKGFSKTFTKNTYLTWAKTFQYLTNPLVVYTDCAEFRDLMKKLRSEGKLNYETEIFFVKRKTLWPFQLVDRIKKVFTQPGYPIHYPNTVNPFYAASQHAKYAVMSDAVQRNLFNTPCYAWLDIGYFRDLVGNNESFELKIPPNFDQSRVAVNLVFNQSMGMDPFRIFRGNIVWVGGGIIIGTRKVVIEFEKLYHKAVLYFLEKNLMNTDQQVLFSMYTNHGRRTLKPKIELQLYIPRGHGNIWFYLGYLCRAVVNQTEIT
ncbi:uncharacterized protein LOC133175738 [Saccostrea echinata]|uniref:uncharacterized protein LOC133175738 n=1 Tax=Saccostrea echinata TaxID=191078 RepID=UPI002A7FEDA0|nr:uncharacterized protein LOC133175738 [Saccostrea echinata]